MASKLSRRTVLRGLGGAVVGLPLLECMLNAARHRARAERGALPKRYAIVFAGQALGGDDYENERAARERREHDAGRPPHRAARDRQRLHAHHAAASARGSAATTSAWSRACAFRTTSTRPRRATCPPGGAFRDFHGGGASPLLCGTRSLEPSFTARSITSDQVIAELNAARPPSTRSCCARSRRST